ncbi:MAG: hypothetical protein EOP24_31870 [Hyphomicrobiales bacterium]|nr:MAG: hypothetical protein EOP24_31870 [Hyphomicrobiales bacterium]
MTPTQYTSVDPATHTLSGLVEEITSMLVILGRGSQKQGDVAAWLLQSAGNDEAAAFELAREMVRRLRGADAGVAAMEVDTAMKAGCAPNFS